MLSAWSVSKRRRTLHPAFAGTRTQGGGFEWCPFSRAADGAESSRFDPHHGRPPESGVLRRRGHRSLLRTTSWHSSRVGRGHRGFRTQPREQPRAHRAAHSRRFLQDLILKGGSTPGVSRGQNRPHVLMSSWEALLRPISGFMGPFGPKRRITAGEATGPYSGRDHERIRKMATASSTWPTGTYP